MLTIFSLLMHSLEQKNQFLGWSAMRKYLLLLLLLLTLNCNRLVLNGVKVKQTKFSINLNFTCFETEKLHSVFWREAKTVKSHHPEKEILTFS